MLFRSDSIESICNDNPDLALIRVDSLRKRCENNDWIECSMPRLESATCTIYKNKADYINTLKHGFASLKSHSANPDDDKIWHLKSLYTISHQYITSQNWVMAAKYIHEIDNLATNHEESHYYKAGTQLLQSLMLMMQYKTDEALDMIDSTHVVMYQDTMTIEGKKRAYKIESRTLQYRGSINGFGSNYQESENNYLKLIDLLLSADSVLMDESTRNQYLLYSYSYLSQLNTYMNKNKEAADNYDKAIFYRNKITTGNRSTRTLADYLYRSARYDELDSLLLPILNSEESNNAILHEIDHLMKLYIRSLYKRKQYTETEIWMERYMNSTLALFQEKGKRSMDEFIYAYSAEEQKVQILEAENDILRMRIWLTVLYLFLLISLIIICVTFYHLKTQKRNNRFLFNQIQEINSAHEKMAELLINKIVSKTELNINEVPEDQVTAQEIQNYLAENDYYLNKDLTIDMVQKHFGISYDTLNKRLNAVIGMSFNEYLIYLRLGYACKLLVSSDLIIDAIADKAGFNTVRTFQRQFKEKYNLSPSQYRKIYNK